MEKKGFGYALNAIIVGIIAFLTLYPFLYILSISLSSYAAVTLGKVFLWPIGINFDAYLTVLRDQRIGTGFYNSILYTSTGTFVSIFLTMLTAYPLSNEKLKYRRILMRMIIFAMLFSGGLIPTYLTISYLGMIDTIWAIIIPSAISPFYLILARTFIQELPGELFESATIDGCSPARMFISIVIPLSKPIIATLVLYYAVGMWNSYFIPMLYLNSDKKYPLQVFLRQIVIIAQMNGMDQRGNIRGNQTLVAESLKSATLIISTIPILLFYPFLQKYFVKGIMIGAIKG
ncbi:MAG: carbohydrate ABC transporter permease [Ruminiclostridium sp.]|nr:carbohydrate ABC transporter permease [Ruminiclostridium sp.]